MAKHTIAQTLRAERAKHPARKLSKRLADFYGKNLTAPWQRERVNEIRALYEEKQRGLDVAHNIASSKLSEEFMNYELEYLETSDRLKEEHDGMEPFHHDIRAVFSRAFWKYALSRVTKIIHG